MASGALAKDMGPRRLTGLFLTLVLGLPAPVTPQDTRGTQDAAAIKRKRLEDRAADFWIYDDIDRGYARAAETGKPMLVSFRCVP